MVTSNPFRELLHRRNRADLDHGWIDLTCLAPESVVLEPLGGLRACQQLGP
jgi:hypothetical protein